MFLASASHSEKPRHSPPPWELGKDTHLAGMVRTQGGGGVGRTRPTWTVAWAMRHAFRSRQSARSNFSATKNGRKAKIVRYLVNLSLEGAVILAQSAGRKTLALGGGTAKQKGNGKGQPSGGEGPGLERRGHPRGQGGVVEGEEDGGQRPGKGVPGVRAS